MHTHVYPVFFLEMAACVYMVYMLVILLLIYVYACACMCMPSCVDLYVYACANHLRHRTVHKYACIHIHVPTHA